ncbi:MAG: sigma-70 family RNA polymerase sigma factor [Candidatus Uhrbacteria bacterium]
MNENSSDKDLVIAFNDGDTSAFRLIVERYQGRIFVLVGYLVAGSGDMEAVRDIVQDTFVEFSRFCRAPHDWTRLSVRSELYRIVLCRSSERVRSSSREISYKNILVALSQARQPQKVSDEDAEKIEAIKQIFEGLQVLERDVREVVVLREIAGMSLEEIAETTSVTKEVVRYRLLQAEGCFTNPR